MAGMAWVSVSLALPISLNAETITNAGIFGNSGEQGATLVRFAPKQASGMGAAYDRFGTLWDRGGEGVLNRYAPDGRLLGTWKIPAIKGNPSGGSLQDSMLLIGDTLLIKDGRKLFTLPITAEPGAQPALLPVEANILSPSSHDGWAAAALDGEIFLVNLAGEKKPILTVTERLFDVEFGPEGGVYMRTLRDVKGTQIISRIDAAAPADNKGPWPRIGNRMQWIAGEAGKPGHWFAHEGHGTVRRFTADFKPDPGVILGGNSGSFIGYVPGNYEMENGCGLTWMGGNLYALSGRTGILHLVEWKEDEKRLEYVRRIGCVARCPSMGITSKGKVYYYGGIWEWTDGPDAPLIHGVPTREGPIACTTTADDQIIAPLTSKNANDCWMQATRGDGPASRHKTEMLPKDSVAATMIPFQKREALLLVNTTGKGVALQLDGKGEPQKKLLDIDLQGSKPLSKISTLSTLSGGNILAAADGAIVEFAPEEATPGTYKELRRWNTWTAPANAQGGGDSSFGARVKVAFSKKRLWVSDTEKHRVLCFTLGASGEPTLIATYGTSGKPSDDLLSLNLPESIAASGDRAVVFDSANQRIVKLEIR